MTYSIDFRKKVLLIKKQENLSFSQIAKRFGVSVNSVFLWSKNLEPRRTRQKAPTKIHNDLLLEDVKKYPDAYMYERAQKALEHFHTHLYSSNLLFNGGYHGKT